MKVITEAEKNTLDYKMNRVKTKSVLRRNVESLVVGQVAKFENHGKDYHKYSQMYNAVSTVKNALGRVFELRQLADGTGAVVTRVA